MIPDLLSVFLMSSISSFSQTTEAGLPGQAVSVPSGPPAGNVTQNLPNTFIAAEEEDGARLDKVLVSAAPGYSRSFLQGVLKEGRVLVNGRQEKASYRVREDDVISFAIPEIIVPDIVPENIPLDVLYEDDDVLVVNKPKGMVVHPAPGHYSGTLVNAALYHCGDSLSGINGVLRPGIVHRIDRDTTGSIILCKNDRAHRSIAEQLRTHAIKRRYEAICYGRLREEERTITGDIGRDPKERKRMAVVPDGTGRHAVTHVHVLHQFRDYAYVECRLETGRTHQIRVHMASIGHPLLGDTTYCGSRTAPYRLEGQCLHASVLGFIHPSTGEYVEITAPLPAYFTHLLEILPE